MDLPPIPPLSPRPHSPRPDPEAELLDALRRRDSVQASWLVQRWVHRHGLAALLVFRDDRLATAEGEVGVAWLDQMLALVPATPVAAAASAGEAKPVERSIAADVDAAIAAMLASFPAEQVSRLPPRRAFAVLEALEDSEPQPPEQALLDRAVPPAPLLEDPEFSLPTAAAASIEAPSASAAPSLSDATLAAAEPWSQGQLPPLSFRIEPPASQPSGQSTGFPPTAGSPQSAAFSSDGRDRLPEGSGDGNEPEPAALISLTARLRRRLPGMADALRGARGRLQALWPGELQPAEEVPEAAIKPASRTSEASRQPQSIAVSAALLEDQSDPPAPAWLPQHQAGALSTAERLPWQLSQPAAVSESVAPAPRPTALAELGAWLPDSELPRAS